MQNGHDKYISIKDWRDDDKPREKLIKNGSEVLSDSELLAIIIGSGTQKYSALDCAKELLNKHGSLTELYNQDVSILVQIKGIGNAKAVSLKAAFEIAKRINATPISKKVKITEPEAIAKVYMSKYLGVKQENFWVILLDTNNNIIKDVKVSTGSLNATIVHPREVFKPAISESAASIIIMHNHPSGNVEPSEQDKSITEKIIHSGNIIGIKVLDHIIIGDNKFFSFANHGLVFK